MVSGPGPPALVGAAGNLLRPIPVDVAVQEAVGAAAAVANAAGVSLVLVAAPAAVFQAGDAADEVLAALVALPNPDRGITVLVKPGADVLLALDQPDRLGRIGIGRLRIALAVARGRERVVFVVDPAHRVAS